MENVPDGSSEEGRVPDWYREALRRQGLPGELAGPVDLDEQLRVRAELASQRFTEMVGGLRRYLDEQHPDA